MITINLLPESYQKPKASPIQELARSPLAFITIGILVALAMGLVGLEQLRQAQLARLTAQLGALEPHKAAVDTLAASVQKLRDQKAVFEGLTRARQQWARHLNALSDATPEGVWFTDLLLDHEKGLILQGSALGESGQEMARIGRLAQDLKANPVFMKTFRDIQIEAIKSVQEQGIEIVEFTVTGALASSPPGGSTTSP